MRAPDQLRVPASRPPATQSIPVTSSLSAAIQPRSRLLVLPETRATRLAAQGASWPVPAKAFSRSKRPDGVILTSAARMTCNRARRTAGQRVVGRPKIQQADISHLPTAAGGGDPFVPVHVGFGRLRPKTGAVMAHGWSRDPCMAGTKRNAARDRARASCLDPNCTCRMQDLQRYEEIAWRQTPALNALHRIFAKWNRCCHNG